VNDTYAVVIEYDPENGSYGATSPDFGIDVIRNRKK